MGRSSFVRLGAAVFVLGQVACSRAAAAALLPTLDVQARAARRAEREGPVREIWNYSLHVRLNFRRRLSASTVPSAVELDPALWVIPCDGTDAICFEEAQGAESELIKLLEGGRP